MVSSSVALAGNLAAKKFLENLAGILVSLRDRPPPGVVERGWVPGWMAWQGSARAYSRAGIPANQLPRFPTRDDMAAMYDIGY